MTVLPPRALDAGITGWRGVSRRLVWVEVTGVLVPVNAAGLVVKEAPVGVHVVNRRRLSRWLRHRPDVLDADTLNVIYDAARRSSTWR